MMMMMMMMMIACMNFVLTMLLINAVKDSGAVSSLD
jgi:hypothetical protein